MKLKALPTIAITLSLGACASVPPPPHCEDNGQGIQPINPEMITQEQATAVRAEKDAAQKHSFIDQGGVDK